jgi:hypothetical protein
MQWVQVQNGLGGSTISMQVKSFPARVREQRFLIFLFRFGQTPNNI